MTSTDTIGKFATIPVITQTVNAVNNNGLTRKLMDSTLGIHPEALLPKYDSNTLQKRDRKRDDNRIKPEATTSTTGKVALFATCYGSYNEPEIGEDLIKVFEHNNIQVKLVQGTQCCGMPKLELGDLEAVEKAKNINITTKIRIYKSNVVSVLLYGSESWKTTNNIKHKLEVFQNRCLRRILGIYWPETISNKDLRKRTGMRSVECEVRARCWNWIGHLCRMERTAIP